MMKCNLRMRSPRLSNRQAQSLALHKIEIECRRAERKFPDALLA